MIKPIIRPITLYNLDDYDLQLNWRVRCGATFALSTYSARMTFWPTEIDRSSFVYQITNPQAAGEGINLDDTSPNIWAHILDTNIDYTIVTAPRWYILELKTPSGPNPATDGVWFRLVQGPVSFVI